MNTSASSATTTTTVRATAPPSPTETLDQPRATPVPATPRPKAQSKPPTPAPLATPPDPPPDLGDDSNVLGFLGSMIVAANKGRFDQVRKFARMVKTVTRYTAAGIIIDEMATVATTCTDPAAFEQKLFGAVSYSKQSSVLLSLAIRHAITDANLPSYASAIIDAYRTKGLADLDAGVQERLGDGLPLDYVTLAKRRTELDQLGTADDDPATSAFVSFAQLAATDFPPVQYVADGLFVRGGNNMVASEPKIGKSYLLADFAAAYTSATPEPWLGKFAIPPPAPGDVRRVFWLTDSAESTPRLFRDRLVALGTDRNAQVFYMEPQHLGVDRILFTDPMIYTRLRDMFTALNVTPNDVLILDSLTRFLAWDETSPTDTDAGMRLVRQLSRATVLCVHHFRKASQIDGDGVFQRIRGSVDIFAAVDSALALKRTTTKGVLEAHVASRYTEEPPPFCIERQIGDDGRIRFVATDDTDTQRADGFVYALIRESGEPGIKRPDIVAAAAQQSIKEGAVNQALAILFHEKKIHKERRKHTMFYWAVNGVSL